MALNFNSPKAGTVPFSQAIKDREEKENWLVQATDEEIKAAAAKRQELLEKYKTQPSGKT